MDSQRLILFFVFSLSLFLLFDAWQRDQQANAPAPAAKPPAAQVEHQAAPPAPPVEKPGVAPSARPPEGSIAEGRGETIKIETDLVRAEVGTLGGDLRRLEFKHHRDTVDKTRNFVLFQRQPEHVYIAQSGFIGGALANHRSLYHAAATEYRLAEGEDTLEVRLEATGTVTGTKIYRFRRGRYAIDIEHQIANPGPSELQPHAYFQLVRDGKAPAGDSAMLPTFTGVAVYTDKEKFQKLAFSDIEVDRLQSLDAVRILLAKPANAQDRGRVWTDHSTGPGSAGTASSRISPCRMSIGIFTAAKRKVRGRAPQILKPIQNSM